MRRKASVPNFRLLTHRVVLFNLLFIRKPVFTQGDLRQLACYHTEKLREMKSYLTAISRHHDIALQLVPLSCRCFLCILVLPSLVIFAACVLNAEPLLISLS